MLSLVGLAGFVACVPVDDSYSRSNPAGIRGRSSTAPSTAPATAASDSTGDGQTSPQTRKTMQELESQELSIRNNASLSPAERQLKLQQIWKEQRDLISMRGTSPAATPEQEQPTPASAQVSPPNPEPNAAQKPSPPADSPTPQPAPNAPPQKGEEPKYATKVQGKNGWIKSPYDGKVLDAAGVPPGTHVKDPDSGKIMIVP